MRFDLADLSLFRHVVEAGSITHGAERAHLALAAASTRIRNMEDVLGVPLLTRSRQGVTPTPAGRTLLQHARTILRQAERLHEDLGAYGGGLAGQIRVLSNTNALTEFLPEALSSFLAAHPTVSVDLEERLSDEIVGLIAEGVADLGIVAGTVDAGGLETYPFRRDRLAALSRHQGGTNRPAVTASRAAAQFRCGMPAGRMQSRYRHRAGNNRAAGVEHHGDQNGPLVRRLGGPRFDDLREEPRRFADLCAATRRTFAGAGVISIRAENALQRHQHPVIQIE